MTGHCHVEVKKVAQAAAGELYELLMNDNQLFAEWKRQNPGLTARGLEVRFIAKNWGRCLQFARATLTQMLTKDLDTNTKDHIMEVLTLDATLMRGRGQEARMLGQSGAKR